MRVKFVKEEGSITELRDRTRAGKWNFQDGSGASCPHQGQAPLLLCGFSAWCFNLTKQNKNRPSGINFFLLMKSRALQGRVLATCSSTTTISTSSFVAATAMSQPCMGEGSSQELGCRCICFPPPKHNNLQQWSLSTFLCSSKAGPPLTPTSPDTVKGDH